MPYINLDAKGLYGGRYDYFIINMHLTPFSFQIFVDGLKKHFQLGSNLDRMFPRLDELTEIHLKFLRALRCRQRKTIVVETISDILLEQFSGDAANKLKAAYGEFCSQHRDAVNIYKILLTENAAFSAFVKHCQVGCKQFFKRTEIILKLER